MSHKLSKWSCVTRVQMIADGLIPVDDIVTHRLPLERFLEGFKLVDGSPESIKV